MSRLNDNERQTLMQLSQCHHEDLTSPRKRYNNCDLLFFHSENGFMSLGSFFATKVIVFMVFKSGICERSWKSANLAFPDLEKV